MEALDLLKPQDRATLAAYCECWATFVAACRDIEANGLTVTNRAIRKDGTTSEWVTKNPSVAIKLAAAVELRHYAACFGLDPQAERNIGRRTDPRRNEANPFDDWASPGGDT
ncbi:terminase [Mycobacterium scrofulaceum]|uniref:Terminase n=1 Tax=Mycobacterium scrofulaceum TaxID=1783 RepID=A0A1A2VQI6_MYCSC|nr:terminase [Mycobacterium scrofulaceum]